MYSSLNYIISDNHTLSLNNRGFAYGDGFFETILYKDKSIKHLRLHFERMEKALLAFKFNAKLDFDKIESQALKLVELNKIEGLGRIRIQIWRQVGGLFTPESSETEILITAIENNNVVSPVKNQISFFEDYHLQETPTSRFKCMSAIEYVQGGIYANENNLDDIIYLDQHGHIAECLHSNIFWLEDDVIHTPSLSTGCVDGTMRKVILNYCNEREISINEGHFSKSKLLASEVVFTSNAGGIQYIENINKNSFSTKNELVEKLQKL